MSGQGAETFRPRPWFRPKDWTATCRILLAGCLLMLAPCSLRAQDEFGEKPAAEAEAATPPTQGAAATPEPEAPAKISVLKWFFEALGWSYTLAFLAMSVILVALIIMNFLNARRENMCPSYLVEGFEAHLNERKYQEAYDLAKSDDTFLGQVLSAGLAKLSHGYPQAIEAMQERAEEEDMKLEHRMSYMALIGTLAPMVGLLGTVDGMIRSFCVIANSPTTPKPSELAKGISTALVTTLVGLLIAIPAIAIYNILKNRISRLVLEVGIVSEGLMGRFQNVGDKKKPQP